MNALLTTIVATGFVVCSNSMAQQSKFDREIPTPDDVRMSLKVAAQLSSTATLSADGIRQIYFAEKSIGRCVWGISAKVADSKLRDQLKMFSTLSDTILGVQCVSYIQSHNSRFRVVDDAWKGEENFWEPNRFWIEQANRHYPNSPQAMEIQFDLEFKEFIRRFNIDDGAKGQSCQEYYDEELSRNLDIYLELYSKEEIARWPNECNAVRDEFQRGRSQLLEKYKFAPFTKVLQDIDLTTIVVFHSVC